MKSYNNGYCPNCNAHQWYEGGGLSTNVKCSVCGLWFNWTPFGLAYIHRHTIEPAKLFEYLCCEKCGYVFGVSVADDGRGFPKCNCGDYLKVCWYSKKFPQEYCEECKIKFSCYTEK